MGKGLYIHIPFCREKCLYCDFYSVSYSRETADEYISVLLKQINELDADFSTVYIGGGTPSILSLGLFERLLSGLKKFAKKDVEFTIEVNPESVDKEKLRLFLDKGINRISIGAQSFDDRKLKFLGRIHGAGQAIEAIGLSKKIGFKNISIDMIFGAEGEDLKMWKDELARGAGSDIQHISCYSLGYEEGTSLFKMREGKDIIPLDEKIMAEMYMYMMSYLAGAGFEHYEVSNFSKAGFECRHNLNYWDNNPYTGLGPSAVSYIDGMRIENVKDVKEYINRYKKGSDLSVTRECLSPLKRAKETASLKIRTGAGIDYSWFKDKTGLSFEEIERDSMEELFRDGLLEHRMSRAAKEKAGIRLTEKGFLFSDTVSAAFL